MANIHTLNDSTSGPNSTPLPNPWTSSSSASSSSYIPPSGVQFIYTGISGERKYYVPREGQQANPLEMCGLACVPCLVPPLWSPEKKQEYLDLAKTFLFVLSVIQILIVFLSIAVGGIAPFHINPSIGPPASTLIDFQAKEASLIHKGQIWRFVTPIFIHAGLIHLLMNVFAQLRFCLVFEKKWKILNFCLIFFISGIGGTIMSCLTEPEKTGVGASGAILGIFGAVFAETLITWNETDPRIRRFNLIQSGIIIVISLIVGTSKYVDLGAHLGGAICGIALGFLFFSKSSQNQKIQKYGFQSSLLFLISYFVFGFLIFYLVVE